jgi:hypothetical protein
MPKFLAGCHYNEEEISRHLKKIYRILAGPNEWQQVCNWSSPEKTGRNCEGADFSWLSSKVSRTLKQLLKGGRERVLPHGPSRAVWLVAGGSPTPLPQPSHPPTHAGKGTLEPRLVSRAGTFLPLDRLGLRCGPSTFRNYFECFERQANKLQFDLEEEQQQQVVTEERPGAGGSVVARVVVVINTIRRRLSTMRG